MIASASTYPMRNTPNIDLTNKVFRRTYYESLRGQQMTERASWLPHWVMLAAFFAPRSPRWDPSQVDMGNRRDFAIINNAGTLALRTLGAGLMTGMSSPTRPWFRIVLQNKKLNERPDVRQWCEAVEDIIRSVLISSNFYDCLRNTYKEVGLFGTSAFLIEADREPNMALNTRIRCHPWPIGEYTLACDPQLRIDLSMRTYSMTARQIVEAFGYESTPDSTQVLTDSPSGGTKETWRTMVHAIHKADYFGTQAEKISRMPWLSTHYELDAFDAGKTKDTAIIQTKGYWENPLAVARWDVVGENIYGESPAMDALGDQMSLQAYEDRLAYGLDIMNKPHMLAAAAIDARKSTFLPGDITYTDRESVKDLFTPAYQIDFGKAGEMTSAQIGKIVSRINEALYKDVFLMIDQSVTRQTTAAEIQARLQEKMTVLGPVVERMVGELHIPAITRVYGILRRFRNPDGSGLFPKMPAVMVDQPLGLSIESILAQAQRMSKATNITQWVGFIGNEDAVDPSAQDNIDLDETTRELGRLWDVPNKLQRTPEQVAKIRADKQAQQQAADRADQAQKLAGAAADLANAPANGSSLLSKVMPQLAGGGPTP
jgi:hypothetical protein